MATKQEEIREGLYLMRFKGRYGKSYRLSYPDVNEILSYLHSQGVVILTSIKLTKQQRQVLGYLYHPGTSFQAVEPLIKED